LLILVGKSNKFSLDIDDTHFTQFLDFLEGFFTQQRVNSCNFRLGWRRQSSSSSSIIKHGPTVLIGNHAQVSSHSLNGGIQEFKANLKVDIVLRALHVEGHDDGIRCILQRSQLKLLKEVNIINISIREQYLTILYFNKAQLVAHFPHKLAYRAGFRHKTYESITFGFGAEDDLDLDYIVEIQGVSLTTKGQDGMEVAGFAFQAVGEEGWEQLP
jgi:hypothetical protein